jgi:hypothetical protein
MFTLSGGYFFRHTYDILGSQTENLPDTFGGTLADSNYGKVNSYGFDVELTFNKQLTRDVSLWARGNFGWAGNKLVEWAEAGVPSHLSRIGKNWDRNYGYVSDGIIWEMTPNGDGTYNILTSNGNRYLVNHDYATRYRGVSHDIEAQSELAMRPGFVFIRDIGSQTTDAEGNTVYSDTPDGYVNSGLADQTWVVEHVNPPYNYGLLLGASWKGFSAEIFLQGLAGNKVNIQHPYDMNSDEWISSVSGYWTKDHFSYESNPKGTMPMPGNFSGFYIINEGPEGNNHSFWMRDASFIRLKMASLAYTFDPKLIGKLGLSSARIHLTGNNLALLYSPLKEHDPELAIASNSLYGFTSAWITTAVGTYPLIRNFTFGLDITF